MATFLNHPLTLIVIAGLIILAVFLFSKHSQDCCRDVKDDRVKKKKVWTEEDEL